MTSTRVEDVAAIEHRIGERFVREYPLALGCRADYGFQIDEQRFLFVEIEVGQTHPQTNVVKYWPWLDESEQREVLLVQLFYGNTRRRRLTAWLGKRLGNVFGGRLIYLPFDAPLNSGDVDQIISCVRGNN